MVYIWRIGFRFGFCKPYYNDDRVKQNSRVIILLYILYTIAYRTHSAVNTRLGRLLYIIIIIHCIVIASATFNAH